MTLPESFPRPFSLTTLHNCCINTWKLVSVLTSSGNQLQSLSRLISLNAHNIGNIISRIGSLQFVADYSRLVTQTELGRAQVDSMFLQKGDEGSDVSLAPVFEDFCFFEEQQSRKGLD